MKILFSLTVYFDTPNEESGSILGDYAESWIDDVVVVGAVGGHGAKTESCNINILNVGKC